MDALEAGNELLSAVLRGEDAGNRLVAAKCMALLHGYAKRWEESPYRIDDVECVLTAALYNPDSGRSSRSFTVAGKLDVLATEVSTGRTVIFDHKTTSEDISDPNANYWRQLVVESQPSHYMLLSHLNGRRCDMAVWDVVRKPGIAPKLLTKKEMATTLESATYCGHPISTDDQEELATTGRETPNMYALRLIEDCANERPERYFQRRVSPRLESEMLEYARDLWDNGQDLLSCRNNERWPRNSGACMLYGAPCKFLPICSGHDSPDSERYERKQYVHSELPVIGEDDGRDVLTNSRIRCFQTCRRKHYYQYEQGIDRVGDDEREALYFGTLWHQALEVYFLELKKQQGGNS